MSVSNDVRDAAAEELENEQNEVIALRLSQVQAVYEDEESARHLRFEGFVLGLVTALVFAFILAVLVVLTR